MGMMALIGINSVEIKSPFQTVISTLSPNRLTNHATLTCNLHPDLAPPTATTTTKTTPHARTTTPVFLLTMQIANKPITTTLRSTSLSPRRPTLHILVKSTVPTSEEAHLVVDVLTDNMDAPIVEACYQDEEEVTAPLNGPETVSI